MAIIETIFYTLIVIGVLVTCHEYGHFWVARRCGIKVVRFSIGFGTPIFKWRDKLGTEFVIALLPLGGYIKMVDEREGDVAAADLPFAFNRKHVGLRMATVVAGPLANFLLAIVAYWIVFMLGVSGVAPVIDEVKPGSVAEAAGLESGQEIIAVDGEPTTTWQALGGQLVRRIGEYGTIRFVVSYPDSNLLYHSEAELNGWDIDTRDPDPIGSIGITLYRPTILPLAREISPAGSAEMAGMIAGDLVISVDGNVMPDWMTWVNYVRARPGQAMLVIVERSGEAITMVVTPRTVTGANDQPVGQVGMSVVVPEWPDELLRETKYGVLEALGKAWSETGKTSMLILSSIKKMIVGDISVEHLSGPITIAKIAGASASYGLAPFLQFMALLSISLGVLNLLPIPVLDGGHLMYFLLEFIKGDPVSEKVQEFGYRLGLFFVIGLMVLALYNDIARL